MPQEMTTQNTVLSKGKVKPQEPVTIFGTGQSKFMPEGKAEVVHRQLAEKLVEKGAATYDSPEGDKKGKAKKGGDE